MANKIRYGLSNTKYAILDDNGGYGEVKDFPGAVSLSLSREGGDSSDFYADNGIYYTFEGTNGGYSAELEMARITDEVRVDLLGEVVDDNTGIQYETTDATAKEFALITEMQGDKGPIGFVFYSCKASRPELNANTKNDSPDVDTDTLNVRIASQEMVIGGVKKSVVQAHIDKTTSTAEQYTNFFAGVVAPGTLTSSGESGLSA